MKENLKYKDNLFVSLFGRCVDAKENFLSLYNALHDTDLKIGEVEIIPMMLENVVYRGVYNDVSMMINGKIIVLAEQQSTINKNMPLRCLEYVTRSFEKLYTTKDKFKSNKIELPAPEFYVFYNGEADFPIETEMKLSDSFKFKENGINLDLIVKVINIKQEMGHKILEKCKPLSEYSYFVKYATDARKNHIENYIKYAMERCLKENLMVKYLENISSEELNMIFGDWDMDEYIKIQREEAFEDGVEQGISQGLVEGQIAIITELLRDGSITKQKAAEKLNISEEELNKLLKK